MQWFSPPIVLAKHWNGIRSSFFHLFNLAMLNPHIIHIINSRKKCKLEKKCCRRNSSAPKRTYCWAAFTGSSFGFWRPYTPYWTPLQNDPGCTTSIKEKNVCKELATRVKNNMPAASAARHALPPQRMWHCSLRGALFWRISHADTVLRTINTKQREICK